MAAQLTRIETCMSDIAASTAGNANFGKKPWAFFEQSYTRLRTGFGTSDSRKKTGRATAGNHDTRRTHRCMLATDGVENNAKERFE